MLSSEFGVPALDLLEGTVVDAIHKPASHRAFRLMPLLYHNFRERQKVPVDCHLLVNQGAPAQMYGLSMRQHRLQAVLKRRRQTGQACRSPPPRSSPAPPDTFLNAVDMQAQSGSAAYQALLCGLYWVQVPLGDVLTILFLDLSHPSAWCLQCTTSDKGKEIRASFTSSSWCFLAAWAPQSAVIKEVNIFCGSIIYLQESMRRQFTIVVHQDDRLAVEQLCNRHISHFKSLCKMHSKC